MTLTIKQKILLECIEWFIKENGYSPTYRELSDLLKCDVRPIFEKCIILEKKGYITTTNGKSRTIRVLRSMESDTKKDS